MPKVARPEGLSSGWSAGPAPACFADDDAAGQDSTRSFAIRGPRGAGNGKECQDSGGHDSRVN